MLFILNLFFFSIFSKPTKPTAIIDFKMIGMIRDHSIIKYAPRGEELCDVRSKCVSVCMREIKKKVKNPEQKS
jgi:hypothetical protein